MAGTAEDYRLTVDPESFTVLQDEAEHTSQSMEDFLLESVQRGIALLQCADSTPGPQPIYVGFGTGETSCDLYALDLGQESASEDADIVQAEPLPPILEEMEKLFQAGREQCDLPLHPDTVILLTLEAKDRGIQRADLLNAFIFFNSQWHRTERAGFAVFLRDAENYDYILGYENEAE